MQKIYFCADFIMTRNATQNYHLRWFSLIVSGALSRFFTDKKLDCFVSDSENGFSRYKFFEKSSIIADLDVPHFYFNPNSISESSLKYLKDSISESLLIGYELSEETREILDKIGITYIDVWLHPIRFLDDNFFAIKSNSKKIQKKLVAHNLSDDHYFLYANKMKIESYMGWNKYEGMIKDNIYENSAVFIGQTLTDKAVCKEGVMLNVLDFKEQFEKLTEEYDHVYYSRHPMIRGDDSNQIKFVTSFDNVSLIDIPAYKLLATDRVKHVVAISSSVVFEAKYFNKSVEYFYKPALNITTNNDLDGYFSVYDKLHSPVFWYSILNSTLDLIYEPKDISFINKKSVYRDMLSLFYNNQVFEKEYFLLKNYNNSKGQPSKTRKKVKNREMVSNKINFEKISKLIDNYDVVSFDVFDTLLERKCFKPSDVILIAARIICARFSNIDVDLFVKLRKEAKSRFSKPEVTLIERYTVVAEQLGLDDLAAKEMCEIEKSVDKELLTTHDIGYKLFQYAVKQKKKVIVITDTYYDECFIREILHSNGYNPNSYYVSSEINKTKESGDMFLYVKRMEKTNFLHIGDNEKADYINSKSNGLEGVLIASNNSFFQKEGPKINHINNSAISSLHNGLIQSNLSKYPVISQDFGFSRGKAINFGYNIVGKIMLSFSLWIINYCQTNSIKRVYFLARDGEIVKKSVDKLISMLGINDIDTYYILASRRSVRVALLRNRNEIDNEVELFLNDLNKSTKKSEVFEYVSLRFGLSREILNSLSLGKVINKDQLDIKKLKKWFSSKRVEKAILDNAKCERELYTRYLNDNNISYNDTDIAFVDIGHNGTLQASLVKLMCLEKSHGLYFATYSKIESNLNDLAGNHYSKGYYRDKVNIKDRSDFYIKYALFIESLFLNSQTTFLKFVEENSNGKLKPLYLPRDQNKRVKFNREIHQGVVEYVENLTNLMMMMLPEITSQEYLEEIDTLGDVCNDLQTFIKNPTFKDAEVFEGVTLENYFSGRPLRYFVPDRMVNIDISKEDIKQALWKEGSEKIHQRFFENKSSDTGSLEFFGWDISSRLLNLERKVISVLVSERKVRKYYKEPNRFFSDSKLPLSSIYTKARKKIIRED
ncbi:MAG: hypothetical protein ACTH5M_04565 [Psychrobacter sp.]|uniref:hypothetical protein n=1 Tax=Psychrobacter sp. AOP7-B1-24 TaxID=3457645 RepID=UPI003FBA7C30